MFLSHFAKLRHIFRKISLMNNHEVNEFLRIYTTIANGHSYSKHFRVTAVCLYTLFNNLTNLTILFYFILEIKQSIVD